MRTCLRAGVCDPKARGAATSRSDRPRCPPLTLGTRNGEFDVARPRLSGGLCPAGRGAYPPPPAIHQHKHARAAVSWRSGGCGVSSYASTPAEGRSALGFMIWVAASQIAHLSYPDHETADWN